jgi:hypothetical protein
MTLNEKEEMVKSRVDGWHGQDCRNISHGRTCNMLTARTLEHRRPGVRVAGLSFRTPRGGPEYDLVGDYVEQQLPLPPRGQRRTVFLEPEIESGFPDIVAVYWHEATAMRWSDVRTTLSEFDIRIAHFLAVAGTTDVATLQPFFRVNIPRSLERLCAAGVVRGCIKGWSLQSMEKTFAVRRLVAIEAKINQWRDGLQQAFQNNWFASESYLLLPRLPKNADVMERAERFGVGVRTRDQELDCVSMPARRERIPKSYASWLFNEWVWRIALLE